MRKTLILAAAVLTAGSLAACKPFWQKDPPPAATAETTSAETTQTAETTTPAAVDPSKPVENTIPVETAKAAPEAKPATPAVK